MNIALIALDVNPPYVGGVVNSVISLAQVFFRRNLNVQILTNKCDNNSGAKRELQGVSFCDVGGFGARSAQGSVRFCMDLIKKARILRDQGVTVFSSHSGYPYFALSTGIVGKLRQIQMFHTVYSPTNQTFCFKFNSSLLTISKNIHDQLVSLYKERVHFVGHGVDIRRFRPSQARVKKDLPVILTCGFGKNRGTDLIVRALPIVRRKIDVELCIIKGGRFNHREHFQLAKSLGVDKYVKWIDSTQKIENFYNLADVFVLPLHNTYGIADIPNSILEAYATNLPVIATPVGGIPEILTEEFIVPKNNHLKLAEKIAKVMESPPKSPQFRRIAEAHSWEKVADRYLEAFHHNG